MGNESTIFTTKWGDELTHLAQQMKALFEGTTLVKTGVVGERCTMEQLAARTMTKITQRHKPIQPNDPDLRRRWITMFDYSDAALFDKQDEMKTLLEPKAAFNQSLIMGANRMRDDIQLAAMNATAYTGKAGTTTQAISNTIANGGTGLTLAKIRQANRTFKENNVDPDEEKFWAISPKDEEDLLKITEVISKDFNGERAVLQNGRVKEFMGFKFIVTNRLTTAASVTAGFCWAKSGVGVAIALEPRLTVSQRNDLTAAPWQAECVMSVGASRLEEEKVIQVDTYHA